MIKSKLGTLTYVFLAMFNSRSLTSASTNILSCWSDRTKDAVAAEVELDETAARIVVLDLA